MIDGKFLLHRLEVLAQISERPGMLVRRFLTPEHGRANDLVAEWMREAGMAVRTDAIGNLIGRYEGDRPGLPALLVGSHLDTVVDAGRFDGMLGVVSAIAAVADLYERKIRLPFAVEIVGFADEEGARFGATLLGSRAMAGSFDLEVLDRPDDAGITMAEAMRRFGLDPARIGEAARTPDSVLAYIELHIEQGPVLEAKGLPAGSVTAISGASRFAVTVQGEAGHAGTVPMGSRRDALAAAAACILAVEEYCRLEDGLVGTVGRIEALPGAVNVVPGAAQFTLDIRAPEDDRRHRAVDAILARFQAIAASRGVGIVPQLTHEGSAAAAAPWLIRQIDEALEANGIRPLHLPSGAGHDGMAMIGIADIAMLFIRCAGGISHNPAEAVTAEDAETGARLLSYVIRNFSVEGSPGRSSPP
jgi:allantoate deiminase